METIYGYDAITLFFRDYTKEEMQKLIPETFLKMVRKPRFENFNIILKYTSKFSFSSPNEEALALLYDLSHRFGYYKIGYVEIARDTIHNTPHDAELSFYNSIGDNMKWARKYLKYENQGDKPKDPDKFGRYSLNFGDRNWFQFTRYPRISKFNEEPAIHEEWKITGSWNIKDKTGIITVLDLINFDCSEYFERLYTDRMNKAEINNFYLGKWCLNWTRRKNFSDKELQKINLAATSFIHFLVRGHNETRATFADFRKAIKTMQGEIGKLPGPKTPEQQKILNIGNNFQPFKISGNEGGPSTNGL